MAATYANIFPAVNTDGIAYAVGSKLPAAEADLYNQTTPYPVQIAADQAVLAVVVLTSQGGAGSNSSYVVMQTALSDGSWIDVAWCVWTGTQGSATFVLSGGVGGENALQQSRAVGTAPGSNGSNQIALGGQIRFVGKATLTSGSSSSSSGSPGVPQQILANITVKQLGLR